MRRTASTAALLVLAWAPHAHARHSRPETDEDKQADQEVEAAETGPHVELGAGLGFGSFGFGTASDIGVGLVAYGGIRFDRIAVLGEYDLLALDAPAGEAMSMPPGVIAFLPPPTAEGPPGTPTGRWQRFGVAARYSLAKPTWVEYGRSTRIDYFVEGGVGEELVHWYAGGELRRPDIALGTGFAAQVRGRRAHFGMGFDVRVTFASAAPVASVMRACGGPCDATTGAPGSDRGILFVFSLAFGN